MTTKTQRSKTADAKAENKEIAAKQQQDLEQTETISSAMFEEDAGAGQEEADRSSYAIPFISILQALSPAVGEDGIEGAKPGLLMDTVTNEMSKTLRIIPCAFQRRFLRWAPNRGGYRGEYMPLEVETGTCSGLSRHGNSYLMDVPTGVEKVFDDQGRALYDELSDTRNHFVLYESASGTWKPAIISLSSTQIKRSKRLMAIINQIELIGAKGKKFNPPSFSHIYELTTEKETNQKGSWYAASFKLESQLTDIELYAKAKAFHQSVMSGSVETAPPVQDSFTDPNNIDPETGEVKF